MSNDKFKEDLPWYVNGCLSDAEKAEFEIQVSNDIDLQSEEKFLKTLRKHLKNDVIQSPGEMGLQRLKRDIKNDAEAKLIPQRAISKWRTFSIAASLMVVVQMGLILSHYQYDDADTYTPLSGDSYSGYVVQVQFKSGVKEQQIRELLLSVNGSIISGPEKNGVYRIQLNNKENDKVVALMRADTSIIEFIEPE